MADNDVTIQIGASVDKLASDVDQAKAHIESITESINVVREGALSLLETFGVAFSASAIADFASRMMEVGEQIERTSAMLGVSTRSAQELGFITKSTGGDAQGLALSMERLQVNLQQAQNSTSRQALALHALGLSAKELLGLSLDEQMNRIADAVSKFADGGNKTAIVIDLMGRSGAQMIPVLDKGRAGLDELRQSADNVGAVMSKQTVEALAAANRATITLHAAVTGLGGTIVGMFAPALAQEENALAKLIGDINVAVQTHTVWEREIIALQGMVAEFSQWLANLGTLAKDVFTLNWGAIAADRQAGMDKIAAIQKDGDEKILAIAKEAKAEMQNLLSGADGGPSKPQAPAIPVVDTSALKASTEVYEGQIKASENAYKQIAQQLEAQVKLHQITYDQETQALFAALDTRWQAELNAYEKELALYPQGSADWQRAWNERAQAYQRFVTEHEAQTDKMLEQDAKQWESMLKPIESAFNSQLRGLLAGTESFGQAFKKMLGDVVIHFIEMAEEMAVKWIAAEAAKTAATAAGVAARTAAESTGAAASLSTQFAAAMESIAIDLGKVFASLAAWLTANFGPAGVPMAVAATAGVGALAVAEMKKFDVGAWEIPGTMPGLLHPGEMVIPAAPAAQLRSALTGGGGAESAAGGGNTIHFNINAIDASSVQRFFQQNADRINRILQGNLNMNPSMGT